MDTAQLRRELTGSIRLLWASERWLWSGLLAVLAGFALWVGATGAALNYGAEFAGVSLSVAPWTSTTTAVFATVVVLWVLAPAAVVTYLANDYVTNVSGNVHTHYRVEHPAVLAVPSLGLFAIGVGAAVAVGDVPVALAGALVAVGLLTLVRTLAYSYRVFSLSAPPLVHLSLFASLSVTAVALVAGAATLAGRRAFVAAAAAGIGDLVGTGRVADILTGTTTVGPVTVSALVGLAAVLPAGLAVAYISVQSAVGATNRVRKPDVPRSRLRTGQRYPAFARPGTDRSPRGGSDRSGPSTAESGDSEQRAAETADADASETPDGTDDGDTDEVDDVSHTKVFTAPNDGDFDADVSGPTGGADGTAVVGSAGGRDDVTADGDGYRCPTCADTFDSDTDFAYCPACGTELEPR